MPAHDSKNRPKNFGIHILVAKKKWDERTPDGHLQVQIFWNSSTRTWDIEGVLEPASPFMDDKHNWQTFEKGIPQGQGEAMVRFIEWVRSLTSHVE